MKSLILLLIVSFTLTVNAQRKTNVKSRFKTSTVSFKNSEVYDLGGGDTIKYLYLSFQNEKYTTIRDLKSIMISTDFDVLEFKNDLKTALSEMKTKSSINWDRKEYKMSVYGFTNTLYLMDKSMRGHTQLKYKEVEKIIQWLETVKL